MASASTPNHHRNSSNLEKSHFQQTLCLSDWWLVKAQNDIQGRRLAVAGFTSREKQAMRVFSSAPILKRYDVFTIETDDGICVILNGFINKTRTVENGFPSDVCNHFIFGFPPYWKEYDEKFMDKESPSKDISGVNLLKKLSPQPGTAECGQPRVVGHEKDYGQQDKMDAKVVWKSKKTKSSAIPLSHKCASVIGVPEDNLNMPLIASEGFEKEPFLGGPSGEGHTSPELPVNCLNKKMKSLLDSSYQENINISAVTDKDVDYSQNHGTGGLLSACHLYNQRRRKMSTDNLRKVESDRKNSRKANFGRDLSSSEEIYSHNDVGVRTHPISSMKMKEKNDHTSARVSGGEKIRLNSVTSMASKKVELAFIDHEAGSRNDLNFEVSGLPRPVDKIQLRLLDDGPVKQGFEQVPETPNQNKGMREIKTKVNIQKVTNKARKSLCTHAAADNQTDNVIAGKNSLPEGAKAADKVTRRKLTYVSKGTPDRGKEKVPSASPQSFTFNRSRSGRLLMPTLEFWRNQRAIYNSDRTITGIDEGVQPEQARNGSESTLRRKRKQPT